MDGHPVVDNHQLSGGEHRADKVVQEQHTEPFQGCPSLFVETRHAVEVDGQVGVVPGAGKNGYGSAPGVLSPSPVNEVEKAVWKRSWRRS